MSTVMHEARPLPGRGRRATAVVALALLLAACGDDDTTVVITQPDTECLQLTDSGGVTVGSGLPGDPAAPEVATGYRTGKTAVYARSYMVVTANPLASRAGCEVLKSGGSAVDAAIAAQMVLGLTEPQSSGIGGGAFLVHYDAATRQVQTYDGRETAPAAATENYLRWISDSQQTAPVPNANFNQIRANGRAIGTPGLLRMLELAHDDHGVLSWQQLFQSGIALATEGFAISGRLAAAIESSRPFLSYDPDAAAYFLNADGTAKALGTRLQNPAYAQTLQAVAAGGANAFYTGAIAQAIVDEIGRTSGGNPAVPITPGLTTLADLANYQAVRREPVCIDYRSSRVCGMGPPSSGGIAVAQTLGILENFDLAPLRPTDVGVEGGEPTIIGVHLVSEAQRLAYADRNRYVADTDFVPLPGGSPAALLAEPYLASRAGLISLTASLGTAPAGNPLAAATGRYGVGSIGTEAGTSQVTIVDKRGNVVSMTTTVESALGSFRLVNGFILNNQLTDFSFAPADAQGNPIANRVQAGKRPRSSMAPTIVLAPPTGGQGGEFVAATGSPGGATIIQYVVKTVVGMLDWGLNAQQATNLVAFGSANGPTTNVGGEHPNIDATVPAGGGLAGANDPLVAGLRALGHTVSVSAQSSGIGTIRKVEINRTIALEGGADPRREGLVLGDTFKP
jgi:gamma-glutamyltranspeptidase/glutathione hydrolase